MSFPIDQARPVRDGEQLDIARLGDYLATHLPGAGQPLSRRAVPARPLELDVLDQGRDGGMGAAPAPVRQPREDGSRHGPRVSHPLAALRTSIRRPHVLCFIVRMNRSWAPRST